MGKLQSLAGKLGVGEPCALCEITHGWVGEKPDFAACREALPVPLDLLHRDEQPFALGELTHGQLPCVVLETDAGWSILLDRATLTACAGDIARFEGALQEALRAPEAEQRVGQG